MIEVVRKGTVAKLLMQLADARDENTVMAKHLAAYESSTTHVGCDHGPAASITVAYWRAQAERDRTNCVRLENRLAVAEGRPVARRSKETTSR